MAYPTAPAIIQATRKWNGNRKNIGVMLQGRLHHLPQPPRTGSHVFKKSGDYLPKKLQHPSPLSALEYNMLVMEILDVAKISVMDGLRVGARKKEGLVVA